MLKRDMLEVEMGTQPRNKKNTWKINGPSCLTHPTCTALKNCFRFFLSAATASDTSDGSRRKTHAKYAIGAGAPVSALPLLAMKELPLDKKQNMEKVRHDLPASAAVRRPGTLPPTDPAVAPFPPS
jgi:hypothetical protein